YLRTLFSSFKDDEQRIANAVEFDDAQLSGATGPAEVIRELKDREETQEMQAFTLGGEHFIDAWTVEYAAGFSKSSEDESGGISGAGFTGDFTGMGFNGTRKPRLIAQPPSLIRPIMIWMKWNTPKA